MSELLQILNARIISGESISEPVCVLVEGKKIKKIQQKRLDVSAKEIDAEGKYLSSGFIDIHVHGGAGFDFMDGDEQGFVAIAELHAQHGTTSMLPTTLSA